MSKTVAIHQPECFPWLGFLHKASLADVFIILDDVQFEKNNFQNRNRILTSQGPQWLTIPIYTSGKSDQRIRDVIMQEEARSPWRKKHLATWRQAYGKAKFGKRYLKFLEDIYETADDRLAFFNTLTILRLFVEFDIHPVIEKSSSLSSTGTSTERLVSLCKAVGADTYLSGVGGRGYLQEDLFRREDIQVRYQDFHHPSYEQRFKPFVSHLTAFDFLFNQGSEEAIKMKLEWRKNGCHQKDV